MNSIPKAGTHLVTQALDTFPGVRYSGIHLGMKSIVSGRVEGPRGQGSGVEIDIDWAHLRQLLERVKLGQYATAHLGADEQLFEVLADLEYKVVAVVRDPRDVVVSAVPYIKRLRRHPRHRRFAHSYANDRERMYAVITGVAADELGPVLPPLRVRLERFRPWLEDPHTLVCRFEDLVGRRGGGSTDAQIRAIRAIAEHIDRPATDRAVRRVAQRTWSTRSATFRAGMIGQWRDRFDRELQEVFDREVGGELLAAYGYEPDD